MPSRLHTAFALFKPAQTALAWQACALCGFKLQVRLCRDEIGVRCLRCGASAISQAFVNVLRQQCADRLAQYDACELSAAGPLVNWLRTRVRSLTCSEFFDDITPGSVHNGITCQNVESLNYADASFDLFTSTEVFEHVADDAAGFAEIHRVLRPGGWHILCVPLNPQGNTVERTTLHAGKREQILPPEFHADRYRGRRVFCYRNYGIDILDRLRSAGFAQAAIHWPQRSVFGYARPIIVARKA